MLAIGKTLAEPILLRRAEIADLDKLWLLALGRHSPDRGNGLVVFQVLPYRLKTDTIGIACWFDTRYGAVMDTVGDTVAHQTVEQARV